LAAKSTPTAARSSKQKAARVISRRSSIAVAA
jgi:hypothetical protein